MTTFRRRDAAAGCIAIGLLPFFENLVTDRVLYEQAGYLAYNSSPLHFFGLYLVRSLAFHGLLVLHADIHQRDLVVQTG